MNYTEAIECGPDNIEEVMHEQEQMLTEILYTATKRPLYQREVRQLAAALCIKSPV